MSEPEAPRSLISRSLALVVLVGLLVAGGCSAWLVVHGDFGRARPAAQPLPGGLDPDR